jgi:hypothetical protein
MPPYLPIYDEADQPRIQAAYEQAEAEWQRAAMWTMGLTAVIPLCAMLAVAMAALMVPSIVVDAIAILAK